MKFAFLILGRFAAARDRAQIRGGVQIVGAADIDEACAAVRRLCFDGVGCIELCGAFGAEGAKRVTDATENKTPVGYVTHLPSQEEPYRSSFLRWRKKKGKSEKNCGKFFFKNRLFPVKRKKSPN